MKKIKTSMTYLFFEKAQQQEDLQDFCSYLAPHLQVLEEIKENLSSADTLIEIRINKILNKYLCDLVNNYCNFSFDYRNKEIIKEEISSQGPKLYTAKDLLLLNLSQIILEIKEVEKDFNETKKRNLLVQQKLLDNLGYEYDSLRLKNQYDIFKRKPNSISKPKEIVKPQEIFMAQSESPIHKPKNYWQKIIHVSVALMVVTGLLVSGLYYNYQNFTKEKASALSQEIYEVQNGVKAYVLLKGSKNIDVSKLKEQGYLHPDTATFGSSKIMLPNAMLDIIEHDNGFDMKISNINSQICEHMMKNFGFKNTQPCDTPYPVVELVDNKPLPN